MTQRRRTPRADRPFVFHHRWHVPSPPERVIDLLGDPLTYPGWWPAIRSAVRFDEDHAAVRLVGLVPVGIVMGREVEDRAGGLLVARLTGDLAGTVSVHVSSAPAASAVSAASVVPAPAPATSAAAARPDPPTAPATSAAATVVPATAPATLVEWEQHVVLCSGWMRRLARVPGARSAMVLSHAAAMRAGRRALGGTRVGPR